MIPRVTNFDIIRHSMNWKLGMQEKDPKNILEQKWDKGFFYKTKKKVVKISGKTFLDMWEEFLSYMGNRLIFGEFRYGEQAPIGVAGFYLDYIKSAEERRTRFSEDKNLEHLVDAANCYYIDWIATKNKKAVKEIAFIYCWYRYEKKYNKCALCVVHDRKDKDRIQKKEVVK